MLRWVAQSAVWDWSRDSAWPWLFAHKPLGAALMATGVGLWARVADLPGVGIFVLALAAATLLVWLLNGVEWRRGSGRQNQPVQDTPTLGDSRMSDNIAEHLWVMLRQVDLQGVGSDPGDRDFTVFRLRIVSALGYPVRFTRIEAELKLNGAPMGVWNEFHTARRAFLPNRLWRGDERVVFVGSDLRRLVEAGVRRSSLSLDVRVTLDSGEVLYLRNANEEPHRGHVEVEDD